MWFDGGMIWVTGASMLIALASMIVAIVASTDARKSRKAAERSAAAAETTAHISSDLYERGKIQFSLHRTDNTLTRILRNNGTHTAYIVAVTAPAFETSISQDGPVELIRNSQIKIRTKIPSGTTDRRLIVHYRNTPGGDDKTVTLHA